MIAQRIPAGESGSPGASLLSEGEAPVIEDQIHGRRCPAHGPQHRRDLAPVVARVIHDVQKQLPQGGRVQISLQIPVLQSGCERIAILSVEPRQPPRVQLRPVFREGLHAEIAIGVEEPGGRGSFDAPEPDPVGGVDVREGTEHAAVGVPEVSVQLILR